MKTKLLSLLFFLLVCGNSFSQNTKHEINSAEITFDITYPDSQLDEQTLANLPSESVMKVKGDLSRVDVKMPIGKTTMISDNKSQSGTMLMDMMGNKWAIDLDNAEVKKQKEGVTKPKILRTREMKTIAGLNCMKAIVTVSDKKGDSTFDVWFTNDVKFRNSFASQIDGIEGFLMEFNTTQNEMTLKMTARKIDVKDIDDSEFVIPDGYTKMTMDDLKKMGAK